jgi:hypothetical protein
MSPQPTKNSLSFFSRIPPEIREPIYHLALYDTWRGRTPALIVALRCSPLFYHEALEVFYETNAYVLSARSMVGISLRSHVRNDVPCTNEHELVEFGLPALWLGKVRTLHVAVPNRADCHLCVLLSSLSVAGL